MTRMATQGRRALGKPSGYEPAPLPLPDVLDYMERLHKDTRWRAQ